jgi:predicted Zn finger-like uncharacterized protein
MKVSCPSCEAKYNIADEKIKGKKVKVRCKSCGTQILVDGNVSQKSAVGANEHLSEAADQDSNSSVAPEPDPSNTWTVNFSDTDERSLTADEIADMALNGQLSNEVFVWKDGMSDWQLVNEVPELASAIAAKRQVSASHRPEAASAAMSKSGENGTASSVFPAAAPTPSIGPIVAAPGSALAKKMASAKNAATQRKSDKTEALKQDALDVAAGTLESSAPKKRATEPPFARKSAPEHPIASKAATKRQAGTHDLFAAVDTAGSEVDVDTSDTETHDVATKATGARNENSVLFSLDALKSGMLGDVAPASAASNQRSPTGPRKKAPGAPAKRLEDLMSVDVMSGAGLGRGGTLGGGGLLLSGNDALLAAPPPPPKPEPKPEPVAQASGGLAGSIAAPPKKRIGLFIGLAVALVAVGAGGAFVALKASTKDVAPVASAASTASATVAASAAQAPSVAPIATTAVAKNEGPDASVPSAGSSATAPQAVAAVKYTGNGKTNPVTSKSPAETKSTDKKAEAKSAEPAAASGAGGFNKDAAVAALSVAASQATVCKRPEGPWGSGRAVITFASSGRVTTANVTGDPFGGTTVGGCVASVFRRAKIPPFSGDPVTVSKSFTIAP